MYCTLFTDLSSKEIGIVGMLPLSEALMHVKKSLKKLLRSEFLIDKSFNFSWWRVYSFYVYVKTISRASNTRLGKTICLYLQRRI